MNKVNADLVKVLDTPDVRWRLEQHGVHNESSTPEQLEKFIKAETVKWAKVVRAAGITAQ